MLAFAQDNGSGDEEEGLAKSGSVGSGFATSRSLVSVFQLRDPYRTAPSKIAMNVTASRVAGSSHTGAFRGLSEVTLRCAVTNPTGN
jgi:hypothetical protein